MALSIEQEQAAESIFDWIAGTQGRIFDDLGEQWMFCLMGYAGSGKTYLLSEIAGQFGIRVHFAAPTGKAASVLMSKMPGVSVITLHRLLYQPLDENVAYLRDLMARHKINPNPALAEEIEKEKAKLAKKGPSFAKKEEGDVMPGDLVIVDEASMVDERLRNDLKATGCRALFVGDPGQLPPVNSSGWFIERKPDAMLETIQRQALDSPIIRFSMDIRNGRARPREWRKALGCGIWKKEEVDPKEWLNWDQVITGSNASRHKVNRYFRKQLGRSNTSVPVAGEKLICLKNDYEHNPQLINGTIFHATGDAELSPDDENYVADICYEGRELSGRLFYGYHCLKHYEPNLKELPREFRKGLMELDFAYAITVHKSQGSEWERVIVADDQMMLHDTNFRRRWLYTAVTRAKGELMIIQ